eukprot:superscaffoldBa00008542_g23427
MLRPTIPTAILPAFLFLVHPSFPTSPRCSCIPPLDPSSRHSSTLIHPSVSDLHPAFMNLPALILPPYPPMPPSAFRDNRTTQSHDTLPCSDAAVGGSPPISHLNGSATSDFLAHYQTLCTGNLSPHIDKVSPPS